MGPCQIEAVRGAVIGAVVATGLLGALAAGTVAGAFGDEIAALRLTSPAFADRQAIPDRFTCAGEGVSPPLAWFDVPNGTRSLVLIVHDELEEPRGVRWLVYDIPPQRSGFGPDTAPADARVGINDFGRRRYEAPCSPRLARYVFSVYALDRRLDLEDADARSIRRSMAGHVLATGSFVGTHRLSSTAQAAGRP